MPAGFRKTERLPSFPRIHLKTLEGGISADVIPAERREDHKFCNAVSGEGFLQESIDHYKSKQTAGVLFMYEEGSPVFFCKIQVQTMDNQIMRPSFIVFWSCSFLQKENTDRRRNRISFWPGLLFSDRYSYVYTSFLCARFFLIICSLMIYPTVLRHK